MAWCGVRTIAARKSESDSCAVSGLQARFCHYPDYISAKTGLSSSITSTSFIVDQSKIDSGTPETLQFQLTDLFDYISNSVFP